MKQIFFYLSIASIILLSGCDIINPEEEIPGYIHLTNLELETKLGEGSNSVNVTEAWVYIDLELLGAFTLPATFPVIQSGTVSLIVDPGIRENAINSTPGLYPFYQRIETSVDLTPGQIDTVELSTTYTENAIFEFTEAFDATSHIFASDVDGNNDTQIVISEENSFEGGKSGLIELDQDNFLMQAASPFLTDFPAGGAAVFLEMNYRTEVDIRIGIRALDIFGEEITEFRHGLRPNDQWNKVYLNLTEQMRDLFTGNFAGYQIIISTALPLENGNFALEEAKIYLDNIKLIHF